MLRERGTSYQEKEKPNPGLIRLLALLAFFLSVEKGLSQGGGNAAGALDYKSTPGLNVSGPRGGERLGLVDEAGKPVETSKQIMPDAKDVLKARGDNEQDPGEKIMREVAESYLGEAGVTIEEFKELLKGGTIFRDRAAYKADEESLKRLTAKK